jgi:CPA1 family monovalent cation:H+ antiporter
MSIGAHDELQLLGLLVCVGALLVLSTTIRVPAPILLVIGGLALGFVPWLPQLSLPPDVVLVAILPPLLYSAAFFTSLRDLRSNVRPISLLAIGLVIATTCGVAVVAHRWVDGLSWAAAFTLGAIVSPTDPLAATEVASRLGVPRRIVAIVEGESLVNDGSALVLYKLAVAAAISGTFSVVDGSLRLVANVVGGVAVGLVAGWLVRQVRRRVNDPPVEVTIALLSGYLAFLPANALGVSGVLAAVTIGVYMGWYTPELTTTETRLSGDAFWGLLTFLVNALLFVLLGLQLRRVVDALGGGTSWPGLLRDAALVCGAVIAIRIVWVPIFTYLPRILFRRIREHDPSPNWRAPLLISWAGLRGAVSLAAALALPSGFPHRNLIVFLTFAVVLATLVGQGLTLPALIRVLGLEDDDSAEREDAKARIKAAEAALARLEELVAEDRVHEETAERIRGQYRFRQDRFRERLAADGDGTIEERSQRYQRVRRELLEAERQTIVALRNAGVIDDAVMHRVERDLDLEDSRLDV